jgi:2-aminobenzoate-CoA ligase
MAERSWTSHVDTYVLDRLPEAEAQPEFLFDLPDVQYPEALNAGVALIDEAVARGWGERIAVVRDDGNWTYGDLLDAANRYARVLRYDFGLVPGQRVLLRGVNSADLMAAWLAVLKAGGVVITTMPMLRAPELASVIEKGRPAIALIDAALRDELDKAVDGTEVRVATLEEAAAAGAPRAPVFENVRTHRDDPALLAFTSGTTGKSKACVHYHRDVLVMADTFGKHVLKASPDDIFIATPPIAFTFGLGATVVFPLRIGAGVSFLAQPSPLALVDQIGRHGVSVLFTAPTSYRQILKTAKPGDLASLRLCVSAGEALDRPTSDAWFERTGIRLIDGIGATEMIHIFISASGDDIRPGSTGKAVPGFEARVIDEAGNEAAADEPGRLAVRGPSGCRYLEDDRQSVYVQNGWNITGDTYRRDADGYFWFVARGDDMIISSGYNIAAPEVEAAVNAHPAVLESAVVAHPDAERGFIAKAFVVLVEGQAGDQALARAIQDFVKATIAPYKYPRAIEFVAALPKTETGKIQRFRLRTT